MVNTFEYARELASIKKCTINTLKASPSFEISETQLLRTEIENLKSHISEIETKYENVMREISLLKKHIGLLKIDKKDNKVIYNNKYIIYNKCIN